MTTPDSTSRTQSLTEELIALSSVTPDDKGCQRRLAELLAPLGFHCESVQSGEVTNLWARRGDAQPLVVFAGHTDVVPTGPLTAWTSDPFKPTLRDGKLYGRGAADDKAGIAAHLAAIRAHGDDLPVGVVVFVEGEEESGSWSLPQILERHREELANDVMVIADSGNWDIGTPALTTSLRGLADCVVEVRTLRHAVHSGMWGGVVPDALTAMARLIATLHDEEGNVAVEGLTTAAASDIDYPEDRLRSESGISEGVRLMGAGSVVERLWTRPAIAVLAIDATPVDQASNTLVPMARAKVSLRVAPGDDAERALGCLRDHLTSHAPWGAQVTVSAGETGQPFSIDATGPAYDAARAAFAEAWDGTAPVDIGVGGSIPFIAELAAMFPAAAILVTGVEDPDTRAHGADEGLHLAEFERVCLAEALLLRNLAG